MALDWRLSPCGDEMLDHIEMHDGRREEKLKYWQSLSHCRNGEKKCSGARRPACPMQHKANSFCPIWPRAGSHCSGGKKGKIADTQLKTELEFPTVMYFCGLSRRKQHISGTSCPAGWDGASPEPPRPHTAATLTRISTGNTGESSPGCSCPRWQPGDVPGCCRKPR